MPDAIEEVIRVSASIGAVLRGDKRLWCGELRKVADYF